MKKSTVYFIYAGVALGAVYAWYRFCSVPTTDTDTPELTLEQRRANTLQFMKTSAPAKPQVAKPQVAKAAPYKQMADVVDINKIIYG